MLMKSKQELPECVLSQRQLLFLIIKERLFHLPAVDEHGFYLGAHLKGAAIGDDHIRILTDLQ